MGGASLGKDKGTGEIATFFNFAKASIGSGSFALPWGILQCGVLLGTTGMVYLGALSVYTMQLMLECKKYVTRSLPVEKRQSLNYTELGRHALGQFGKWAVDISVLCCNLGVCAGYLVFIASNLQWAFTCLSGSHNHDYICFTTWEVYAFIVPILIILTYLPSFRLLAYAAYVGAIFLVVAMVVVYVYGGSHCFLAVEDGVRYLPDTWKGVAKWFGVTAFLFCVHSMVIPLESVMKRPQRMPYVLDAAAVVVVGVNLPFALYGYLLFGSGTQGYIFENLPGGVFNDIVRVFLSLELTLTFPIVFKPASEVAEEIFYNSMMFCSRKANSEYIVELYHSSRLNYRILKTVMICALRTVLVLLSWGLAVAIPHFELIVALVGSLATTVLAFILPPLFHLVLKWRFTHIARRIFHLAILIFGIFASGVATGVNLYGAITSPPPANCSAIQTQCELNNTYCSM